MSDFAGMTDLYEQWASETLTSANQQEPHEGDWRNAFEEIASEMLSLARASREAQP